GDQISPPDGRHRGRGRRPGRRIRPGGGPERLLPARQPRLCDHHQHHAGARPDAHAVGHHGGGRADDHRDSDRLPAHNGHPDHRVGRAADRLTHHASHRQRQHLDKDPNRHHARQAHRLRPRHRPQRVLGVGLEGRYRRRRRHWEERGWRQRPGPH
ncbi:MAG: hypothetical protein AVDCRST_MAG76-1982, partial [uncultured Acidimicrobiales bacterium]